MLAKSKLYLAVGVSLISLTLVVVSVLLTAVQNPRQLPLRLGLAVLLAISLLITVVQQRRRQDAKHGRRARVDTRWTLAVTTVLGWIAALGLAASLLGYLGG